MQLDTFDKIVIAKATVPSRGSLLSFLVQLIENEEPELLKISSQWIAIWAATEVI